MNPPGGGKLSIAWYFHMPSVMKDEEISDLVRESMLPLVRLHRELDTPFSLAITGVLLSRMENIEQEFLKLLKIEVENGLIDLMGTFYHEIFPPIVPYGYLVEHVRKDIEIKNRLFSIAPRSFFLANYTWVPVLQHIFEEFGYRSIIMDQNHFDAATRVQVWKWRFDQAQSMQSYLVDTVIDSEERRRSYYLERSDQQFDRWLELRFRSADLVKLLSFGTTGAIHHPTDPHVIEKVAGCILDAMNTSDIVLADDGDRINSVSLPGYEIFLRAIGSAEFALISVLKKLPAGGRVFQYLPGYSPAGHAEFWLSDFDAIHYQTLMQELYRTRGRGIDNDILELQDVFFLFWKTYHRKRWYVEQLVKMLATHETARYDWLNHSGN